MPLFAKCFNPVCYCFGQWQAATGACADCGAPLHLVIEQSPPDSLKMPSYFVLFSGPEALGVPVVTAANSDDAAAQAIQKLAELGMDQDRFRVERVYGPDDIPRM